MRITLTLSELEKGSSIQGGPKDRLLDLAVMANRREPVAIRPVTNHDRRIIGAVLLTEGTMIGKELEIKFKPIWCKVFTLCSSTKDKILAFTVETDHGQFWIDSNDSHPSSMTLAGDGTDPKIVKNSQYVLGELLTTERRTDIILNLIRFIQNQF